MPIIYHRDTNTYEDTTPPPPEDLSDPEEYEVISLIYHRQLRRYIDPGARLFFRKADAELLIAAGAIARIDQIVKQLEELEAAIRADMPDAASSGSSLIQGLADGLGDIPDATPDDPEWRLDEAE